MEILAGFEEREQEIVDLFTAVFTASEGPEEGQLIGDLVSNLLYGTPNKDMFVFTAVANEAVMGAIIFSRLIYDKDERSVFLLAPIAVATGQQGKGVGQTLLSHGLAALREAGVDIVMTYGDPNYYSRMGFTPLTEALAPAPFRLSQPEGWQGQSLTACKMTPLKGPARCVEALDDPAYW
ncbi:GNAT family N-acetyltransferase [Fodinicurvata fenggangensis]|uniref:GNAT family N-acetyltransferase n=1 Tax=Fodinicurvata fenggangensis TaxID=1121830 RepID=UPI00047A6B00|nr:N-acetyltransferase [Fodinicurvata fenggangensis]